MLVLFMAFLRTDIINSEKYFTYFDTVPCNLVHNPYKPNPESNYVKKIVLNKFVNSNN